MEVRPMELQKKNYRELITGTPNWIYYGTFVDDGFVISNGDSTDGAAVHASTATGASIFVNFSGHFSNLLNLVKTGTFDNIARDISNIKLYIPFSLEFCTAYSTKSAERLFSLFFSRRKLHFEKAILSDFVLLKQNARALCAAPPAGLLQK